MKETHHVRYRSPPCRLGPHLARCADARRQLRAICHHGQTVVRVRQISNGPDGLICGKLGADLTTEDGAFAAATCALALLAQAKAATGDLTKVARLVKLVGFVNSTADFTDQPKVINGASDLMVAVLGDAGRHARSAVSAVSLPLGVAVEIEAIFELV